MRKSEPAAEKLTTIVEYSTLYEWQALCPNRSFVGSQNPEANHAQQVVHKRNYLLSDWG